MNRLIAQVFLWLALLHASHCFAQGASPVTAPERQVLVMLRQNLPRYHADSAYGGSYGNKTQNALNERRARKIADSYGIDYAGLWPMPILGIDCLIMTVPDARSAESVAAEIAQDKEVEWAQPVQLYKTLGNPVGYDDPLLPVEPAAQQWRLIDLHKLATGKGVTVAVIDTRIDSDHPDLAGQIIAEQDFTDAGSSGAESHGTAVAGVIAAKGNNHIGMVGVSPRARILGLRACSQLSDPNNSVCDSLSLAKALHFAIEKGSRIINMSLSGPPDRLLNALINKGLTQGIAIVASVDAKAADGGFPASMPGVIAVSDSKEAHMPSGVISAPGANIPTTEPGAKWNLVNGSSFSAAHVSGLIALILEHKSRDGDNKNMFVTTPGKSTVIDAYATVVRAKQRLD